MSLDRIVAERVRALSNEQIVALVGDRLLESAFSNLSAAPLSEVGASDLQLVDEPKKSAPRPAKKPAGKKAAAPAAAKKAKGEKRGPGALARISEELMTHIEDNPGQGVEQIAKALGYSTKALALPVRKLLASRRLRTEGVKRATRYYSRGGANGVAAAEVN